MSDAVAAIQPKELREPVSGALSEARVFARLRRRLLHNHVSSWLRDSRLRLCLLLVFSVLFWFLLFALFLRV